MTNQGIRPGFGRASDCASVRFVHLILVCVFVLPLFGCSVFKIEAQRIEVKVIETQSIVMMPTGTTMDPLTQFMTNGVPIDIGVGDLHKSPDYAGFLQIGQISGTDYANGIELKLFVHDMTGVDVSNLFKFDNRTGEYAVNETPTRHRFTLTPKLDADLPNEVYELVIKVKPLGASDDDYKNKATGNLLLNP